MAIANDVVLPELEIVHFVSAKPMGLWFMNEPDSLMPTIAFVTSYLVPAPEGEDRASGVVSMVEFDALAVRAAPKGVKMRGRLLSGGFETWLADTPNTNNPSGLPIENIVVADRWEG